MNPRGATASRSSPLLGVFVCGGRGDAPFVLRCAAELGRRRDQDLLVILGRPVISEFGLRYAGMNPEKVFHELAMAHRRLVRRALGSGGMLPSYSIATSAWPALPRAIHLAGRHGCSLLVLPGVGSRATRAAYRSIGSHVGQALHFAS